MVKAGIINVTGYAGIEIARIIQRHPEVEITCITGRSSVGKNIKEIFPHLAPIDMTISEDITESVDVVFSALPHAASAERLGPLVSSGIKAIDISADFRLDDISEYHHWYKVNHPHPDLIKESVYGLPEINRNKISTANLVANPGCYPTAAILAMAPAIKAGIIEPDIIIDAKSGVSGAGRKASIENLYSEINENLRVYALDGHRHMPEIAQELRKLEPVREPSVTFVPHLVPMTRGILATCYAPLNPDNSSLEENPDFRIREVYKDFFNQAPFTHITERAPETKNTLGNNDCNVFPVIDTRSNRLIVVSCIDNLVKGAAGQAVQNMNLMFGLAEDQGLGQLALYP